MAEDELPRREHEALPHGVLRHVGRPHEDVKRLEKIGGRRSGVREPAERESISCQEIRELVVDMRERDRGDRKEREPHREREERESRGRERDLVTSQAVTPEVGPPGAQARLLERALLLTILLRLIATSLLVPPFSGFDEPYHLALVASCRDRALFPDFLATALPSDLVDGIRRWPLPPAYARELGGTPWGRTPPDAPAPAQALENYETQQGPLFYAIAGRIAALVPVRSAVGLLYLFRSLDALLAFGVAMLTRKGARALGFGERAWLPLAVLAFVPGFALALARLSNDALAALLVSVAVLGTLRAAGPSLWSALAAGLAPAAKLYGWAALVLPVGRALRRRDTRGMAIAGALVLPGAAVAAWAWARNGSPLPLQENLRDVTSAALGEVPWLRDAWTIAKTHVWVSGMGFHVFPAGVHLLAVLALFGLAALTIAEVRRDPRLRAPAFALAAPLALFGSALAYHAWRNYSYFRDAGGTGGWYLWAAALPEALFLTLGLSRRPRLTGLAAGLALFLALAAAGDVALVLEGTGALLESGAHHRIAGIADASPGIVVETFLASRPRPLALLALVLGPLSWASGAWAIASVRGFARAVRP